MKTGTQPLRRALAPRTHTITLVGGLTTLALLLRLLLLAHKSFWLDEAASFAIVSLDRPAFYHSLWSRELNMVLYYMLLRAWLHLGTSDWTIRLLSVIPSVLTVPVIYALGARLISRRAGLWSALLLSLSASHLAYAQEARGYALVVLWVALSFLFLVRALGLEAQAQPRTVCAWSWVGYVLCAAAAVYTQFFAVLVIAAQWISVLAWPPARRSWRRPVLSCLALAVLTLPAVWFVLTKTTDQLAWIDRLSFTVVFKTLALLAGNSVALILYLPLWWIAVKGLKGTESLSVAESWPQFFLLTWLSLPFTVALLTSLRRPILQPRFLLVSLPAGVLLAAAGLEKLQSAHRRVALLATVLLSVAGVIYYYARKQEDWRGATAYVLQHAQPGDAVFIAPPYGQVGFRYYQRFQPAIPVVLHAPEELNGAETFPRLWILLYGKKSDPSVRALRDHIPGNYKLTLDRHFNKIDTQLFVPARAAENISNLESRTLR